ncbi:hypothetical protein RM844_14450 [Streptomyces sp. DSM 44915]|uniref:Uncharacterized protein n=1 Tax=Streptomyces chisholmiae TaxID=3075540 RepID=A0ABU2JRD7_9ACTN|nr:hypothetical protein [Streptomyces sp. DSM 44915]MDT0267487.1 hypothetical protein [Streptomyces sp. DSM 44915]
MSLRRFVSRAVVSVAAVTLGVLGLAGTASADVVVGFEAGGISSTVNWFDND